MEKWGPRLLKGEKEHTEGPGRAVQTEREQVRRKSKGLAGSRHDPGLDSWGPAPPPREIGGVARGAPGAPGRSGAERCSPAMCWRRASSRCVDSTSPMARRSRGRICPPLLRQTPLAPWSPQALLPPPPRSPAAASAALRSHRDPRRVPPAGRCCSSSPCVPQRCTVGNSEGLSTKVEEREPQTSLLESMKPE